jgi:hypothetical protein
MCSIYVNAMPFFFNARRVSFNSSNTTFILGYTTAKTREYMKWDGTWREIQRMKITMRPKSRDVCIEDKLCTIYRTHSSRNNGSE